MHLLSQYPVPFNEKKGAKIHPSRILRNWPMLSGKKEACLMDRLKRIGSKQNGDCEANSHQSETADVSWDWRDFGEGPSSLHSGS